MNMRNIITSESTAEGFLAMQSHYSLDSYVLARCSVGDLACIAELTHGLMAGTIGGVFLKQFVEQEIDRRDDELSERGMAYLSCQEWPSSELCSFVMALRVILQRRSDYSKNVQAFFDKCFDLAVSVLEVRLQLAEGANHV